jgi:hypothetical protein
LKPPEEYDQIVITRFLDEQGNVQCHINGTHMSPLGPSEFPWPDMALMMASALPHAIAQSFPPKEKSNLVLVQNGKVASP